MANPDLGIKRICQSCSTKFYDLKKTPIVCPKCSTEYVMDPSAVRGRRGRPAKAEVEGRGASRVRTVDLDDDDDAVLLDDDEDIGDDFDDDDAADAGDDMIEDASDLGGEDDGIAPDVLKDD